MEGPLEADLSALESSVSAGPLLAALVARRPTAGVPDRFRVRQIPVSIGRAADRGLRLGVASVSDDHAELWLEDGVWWLADHGSTAGTTVDGEPVSEPAAVAPGSLLGFGEVELVFVPYDRREHSPVSAAAPVDPVPATPSRSREAVPMLLADEPTAGREWTWLLWTGLAVIVAAGLAIFFLRGG